MDVAIFFFLTYVLVCVVGHFVVAPCMYGMRRLSLTDEYLKKRKPKFWGDWSVFFIGATERAVALTLVLLTSPYLPSFIGGWVLLKFSLGWRREDAADPDVRTDSMLGLVGSVLSFAIPIVVGVVLYPAALKVWVNAH